MFCRNTWCTTQHERTVTALYSSDDNECVVRSDTAVTSRLYSVSSSFAYGFFKTAHQAEKSLLSCRDELSDVTVTQRTGNCCWLLFNALVATTSARQRHDSRPMAQRLPEHTLGYSTVRRRAGRFTTTPAHTTATNNTRCPSGAKCTWPVSWVGELCL